MTVGNRQEKLAKVFLLCTVFLILGSETWIYTIRGQNVGIGTAHPHPSATLEVWDTIRGILIPRLTTQQRNAIQNPAHTLIIFNIDSFCLEVYDTVTSRWYTISCPRNCLKPACVPVIQGPSTVCSGDTVVYYVSGCPQQGVNYQWTFPPSWTILDGENRDTIVVVPDTTNGTLSVKVCNACGCSYSSSALTVNADSCITFCAAIGGASTDWAYSIAQTADGGYVLAGYTASFGAGGTDVYLVRLNKWGGVVWTRTIGGASDDAAYSIVQTADGGFAITGFTGSFGAGNYDMYVVRVDSLGNVLWTRTVGGSSWDYGFSIVQTSDGGFAIAGTTFSFGAGNFDVYVVRLDSAGNVVWTRTIGGSSSERGYSIVHTSDGGFAITGFTTSFGAGGADIYVIKMSSAGTIQWVRTIGGPADEDSREIIQTDDGGYAIAGLTWSFGAGSRDVYVVKLNSSGAIEWTRSIGGSNNDAGSAITQTRDGGYVVVGRTASFGAGSYDVYVIKLDSTGAVEWIRTVGGPFNDFGHAVVQTSDGGYAIAESTYSFGVGAPDIFFFKLDPSGNLRGCPSGCQVGTGGITASGGSMGAGGSVNSGGVSGSGGLSGSGGTLTQICP